MKKFKIGNVTFDNYDGEKRVIMDTKFINECISYVNEQRIRSIIIDFNYYPDNKLDLLKECPKVEKIIIDSPYIKDFSGIYHLKNIKELNISDGKANLDFRKLPSLEILSFEWTKNISGLGELLNIRKLEIKSYRPKDGTLSELSNLENLEELNLNHGNVCSLAGVKGIANLKTLGLYYLKNLNDITELNSTSIKELFIENCKNIGGGVEVIKADTLQKLTLSNCGEITSLDFILKLKNLRFFSFVGTNILDGDISPCLGLEFVGFNNKKHYSHKSSFFKSN